MHIHFIAIGGSAMHNLALALQQKGLTITGSDDEFFEPSKSRLAAKGLLPEAASWFPEKITKNIDAIVLGMHARKDNPELLKAQELGIKIYSYPAFVYEQSIQKNRVVIGGSHGKTTITSMILHVLQYHNRKFDYLVGALLKGFDLMVGLNDEHKDIIIEGDEYLASPIHLHPKFLDYKANIAVISGIAWDHINVFKTFESYREQFSLFIQSIEANGVLIYNAEDKEVVYVVQHQDRKDIQCIPYKALDHSLAKGITSLNYEGKSYPLQVFGAHNLSNMAAAFGVLEQLGLSRLQCIEAIQSFEGASKRLETIAKNKRTIVYKDFAHSPSKLKATTQAVKSQFPNRELIAIMELHTFSSLNKNFLNEYKHTINSADTAIVYFNPKTIEHKKLEMISKDDIKNAFQKPGLKVFTQSQELMDYITQLDYKEKNVLIMTSGNFDGLDLEAIGFAICS
jgi:UDP-N-acetylmuramate: L-alanyl-gamma-D-glutamyl-meso-diaminopimelate ligase